MFIFIQPWYPTIGIGIAIGIDDFDCDIDSDFDYTSQPILIEFFERPHFDATVHYSDIFEPGVVEY